MVRVAVSGFMVLLAVISGGQTATIGPYGYNYGASVLPFANWGSSLELTASPRDVVAGVTSQLTLTCLVGENEDLNQILLIQLNHVANDSTKIPVADVTARTSARRHDYTRGMDVYGHIPYSGHHNAYLRVTINQPTEDDCGQWECTLSGLDSNLLSIRQSATTIVHVTDLASLATEVGELRREVLAAETDNQNLQSELQQLQQRKGQGFTAYHLSNTTASFGRLTFQREAVDTLGGFYNSALTPPLDGLYLLSLSVGVSQNHDVTVALRQGQTTLMTLTAQGGSETVGQSSASVVAALTRNEVVDVEVIAFSSGAQVLASPFTLLSGHLI